MNGDAGPRVCTDEEIDDALAVFRSDVPVSEESVRRARAELTAVIDPGAAAAWTPTPVRAVRPLAVVGPPSRRRNLRLPASGLVAAAAVVALVVGVLTVSSRVGGDLDAGGPSSRITGGAPARADEVLTRSADLVAGEEPDGRKFRYVEVRASYREEYRTDDDGAPVTVMAEHVTRLWIPADRAAEWRLDAIRTGKHELVDGGDRALRALEARHPSLAADLREDLAPEVATLREDAGRFRLADAERPQWRLPTPEVLAGLPRDPQQLYDRLRRAASDGRSGDPGSGDVLAYAGALLKLGFAPPDLQAALYRALRLVPGLQVTGQVPDLDGRVGTALGAPPAPGEHRGRGELIIDERTGALLGERRFGADGAVRMLTAVTVTGADRSGVVPTG